MEESSIENIYLGSRSKSPLYDELSIPFIDASLPPTPKADRSKNPLEILLGRSLGSSTSLSGKRHSAHHCLNHFISDKDS